MSPTIHRTPVRGAEPFDVCEGPCSHEECRLLRGIAEAECYLCHRPLGYGADYTEEQPRGPVHVACLGGRS